LTAAARERAGDLRRVEPDLGDPGRKPQATPGFLDALRPGIRVAIIAEIKRFSPSKGALHPGMDVGARACQYVAGGAAALSVLTEPTEFGGDPAHLREVGAMVGVPLLKKDFHVEELQVAEARALGASALLLIARALEPSRLTDLIAVAFGEEVEPVVEVRSEDELERALVAGARAIGVNARDLETLVIEPEVLARILPRIPRGCLAIAESGMSRPEDVQRVADLGADAVLIGSAFSLAADPVHAVASLAGVLRRPRAT
jgi:indole-3-glycerol phosphate synthase